MAQVGAARKNWGMTMRTIALALIFSALAAGPVAAQAPPLGKLEIKVFQPIPKTKTAVQLNVDTALGRHLRGEVMGRLARRGNEVGFSGGNIMRMDVGYLDLGGGSDSGSATIGGQPSYVPPGSNPRPELPSNRVLRRDLIDIPKSKSTLRITLQLYNATTGKVIWGATASCATDGTAAVERVGDSMVEAIFKDADHSHVADAGCPL
jgi:hypothetical protein